MRISLITTVKNEENSIRAFLESILQQSRPPDEFIIVDGGSTDKTVEILQEYTPLFKRKNIIYKIIVKKGANIAKGRNIAISNSSGDIIACTDAGCVLSKAWLEEIARSFEQDPSVDIVSGWYEPLATSKFEEIVAEITYPKLKKVLRNPSKFLPSSRSIAFKKKCWKKVGGYPEWLYTAEDTLYDILLKRAGCKFVFNPNAVVYWKVRENLRKLFRQYYNYAKGDGEANLFFWRYFLVCYFPIIAILISLIYWRTNNVSPLLLGIIYLTGLISYLFGEVIYRGGSVRKILVNLPLALIIEITILVARTIGYTYGFLKRFKYKKTTKELTRL
ncbi:glycosyltransferase family 2 protein [Pyrococcus abyssi]|uniref:Glycosyltransferase, putative n=1 Tax=Pyrococcus abyssi (strain GE5 / Orsay) TaxID=272844 RepID=Q9UZF9_PYRAB|nr:glycosyltransferase family 2 protein [Pyrococcus abyssi]CAB50100.1 Glycosyltransferase, putative [Pyrococcus abyssi GE5]CCE70620.1 TPA: sugar transferase related protein [Pyrococcus abyssi GE5]